MEKTMLPPQIERFLAAQREKGCQEATLSQYRNILFSLCNSMAPGGELTAETGRRWRKSLDQSGLAPRTVNVRISVWNRFVEFLRQPEWQMDDFHRDLGKDHPQLTREEYLQLLSTARQMGKEQTYLLIKTVGGAGVRMRELPELTVNAVEQGTLCIRATNDTRTRKVSIPACLQKELLNFIHWRKITQGPVFQAQNGTPLSRVVAHRNIRGVGRNAKVPENKANLRCLSQLYDNTQADIRANAALLFQRAYDQIMEHEQLTVGWDLR